MLLYALLLVLAPLGAYALLIIFVHKINNFDYNTSVWYTSETILDIIYARSNHWLHSTDFPFKAKKDLENLYTTDSIRKWNYLLNLCSIKTEWVTITEGVPVYAFIVPWIEENENAIRTIISNLSSISLSSIHCSNSKVIVEFFDTNIPNFRICRIMYSRTANEQLAFLKIHNTSVSKEIGGSATEVRDQALDEELQNYGG